MWMRGYNDGGDQFSSIEDNSLGSRKLRPLMPRPTTVNSSGLAQIYGHDLLTLNHHLAMVDQNKRESSIGQQVIVSSRWNPTPEQLQTLEELYRRGTRTPSAEQIQCITAQLRKYGKIEGKNVFYWFQNHKARERQKRRRQESASDELPAHHGDKKDPSPGTNLGVYGGNRRAIEVDQTKNWVSSSNCRTIAEKSVSTQGGAAAKGAAEAESKGAGGWLQFDEDADQLQQGTNATWRRMMHLSYPPSSNTLIINNSSSANTTTVQSSLTKTTHDFIDLFPSPAADTCQPHKTQTTLQLFPVRNDEGHEIGDDDEARVDAMHAANAAYQFFEFLPLKS